MSCRYKGTIICQEVAKAKNVCQASFCPSHKRFWFESCQSPLLTPAYYKASPAVLPSCAALTDFIFNSCSLIALFQVCLLDLDYNLPVQVRDQALGTEDEALPESDVGREFALERMANEGELGVGYNKSKPNDTILKLQRTAPYYQVGIWQMSLRAKIVPTIWNMPRAAR